MADIVKRDKIRVQLYTAFYKVEGEIPTHEGYRGRLSDMLNDAKMFLNLSNAVIYSLNNNQEIARSNFLCFNKSDIIFTLPID